MSSTGWNPCRKVLDGAETETFAIPIRRSGRRRAPGAALVALALLATACGGGDDAEKPAGSTGGGSAASTTTVLENTGAPSGQLPGGTGTCTLVNESEVATAVGTAVKAVAAGRRPEGQVCTFAVAAQSNPPQTVLIVTSTSPQAPSAYDSARQGAGSKVQNVTGIGDRAFSAGGQVVALKGRTLLVVTVDLQQSATTVGSAARKLAETAIGRV